MKSNNSLTDADQKDATQSNSRRGNASGYSWWKWSRRSTDSNDKGMSPPKDLEARDVTKLSRQVFEGVEINEGNELENKIIQSPETEEFVMKSLPEIETSNADIADSINKNDDSISSELADVSKNSFSNEKYRKTLRLTSEQIVSHSTIYVIVIKIKVFFFCK